MSEVQQQLQELKSHLDGEQVDREEERKLVDKVESLKEEFRELLAELRRKRMSQGGTVLSDDVRSVLIYLTISHSLFEIRLEKGPVNIYILCLTEVIRTV